MDWWSNYSFLWPVFFRIGTKPCNLLLHHDSTHQILQIRLHIFVMKHPAVHDINNPKSFPDWESITKILRRSLITRGVIVNVLCGCIFGNLTPWICIFNSCCICNISTDLFKKRGWWWKFGMFWAFRNFLLEKKRRLKKCWKHLEASLLLPTAVGFLISLLTNKDGKEDSKEERGLVKKNKTNKNKKKKKRKTKKRRGFFF